MNGVPFCVGTESRLLPVEQLWNELRDYLYQCGPKEHPTSDKEGTRLTGCALQTPSCCCFLLLCPSWAAELLAVWRKVSTQEQARNQQVVVSFRTSYASLTVEAGCSFLSWWVQIGSQIEEAVAVKSVSTYWWGASYRMEWSDTWLSVTDEISFPFHFLVTALLQRSFFDYFVMERMLICCRVI